MHEVRAERTAVRRVAEEWHELYGRIPFDVVAGDKADNELLLDVVRNDIEYLNAEYARALARAGLTVALIPAAYSEVAKLLHAAALADSERDGAALLHRARALAGGTKGRRESEQEHPKDANLRRFVAKPN